MSIEIFKIKRRDGSTCSNCGKEVGKGDRVVAIGDIDPKSENYVWVCQDCILDIIGMMLGAKKD